MTTHHSPLTTHLLAALFLLLLSGCADTGSGVEVQGTVTYDGEPIKAGVIAFVATESKQTSNGGTILDGKYRIPPNVGPSTGRFRVEIRWAKPTGRQYRSETGAMLEVTEEGLPAKFNEATELTADLKAGTNTVNFDLEK